MIYIEALNDITEYSKEAPLQKPVLFLAGGITNCPNWQEKIVNYLKNEDIYILNPRRKNFPIDDPNASEEQIRWEFNALQLADIISFWFPKETLCPITLYELGFWNNSEKPIIIGMDKKYKRKQDVIIQSKLIRDTVNINYTLKELAKNIIEYL